MMQAKKSQKEPSKRPFFPLFLQRNAKAAWDHHVPAY
jgi:hypothetical protein